jgi:hypothetical protein
MILLFHVSTLQGLGDLHNALASVPAAAALPGVLTALNEVCDC